MKPLDQFDVEPYQLYNGSIYDHILSGSILNATGRITVGYHTSSSSELNSAKLFSSFVRFSGSVSNRTLKGPNIKTSNFYSYDEKFYDSVPPDASAIYLQNSGAFCGTWYETESSIDLFGTVADEQAPKMVISTYGGHLDITASNVADGKWLASFPNELKYRSIAKMKDGSFSRIQKAITKTEMFTTGALSYDAGAISDLFARPITNIEFIDYSQLVITNGTKNSEKRYAFLDITGSAVTGTFYITGTQSPYLPTASIASFDYTKGVRLPQENILGRAFFGFGDGYCNLPTFITASSSSVHFGSSGVKNWWYGFYPEIRGWKFGLMNCKPVYTFCVYRNNRYGQIRDMLEQRLFSKLYVINGVKTGFDSPIKISFVSGSNSYVTASSPLTLNTRDSGMYDFEYVAGRPFFDT
jgi:hypothetical protein